MKYRARYMAAKGPETYFHNLASIISRKKPWRRMIFLLLSNARRFLGGGHGRRCGETQYSSVLKDPMKPLPHDEQRLQSGGYEIKISSNADSLKDS